ncbi:hypothetical protein [Bradyrhizobium cenepequi]
MSPLDGVNEVRWNLMARIGLLMDFRWSGPGARRGSTAPGASSEGKVTRANESYEGLKRGRHRGPRRQVRSRSAIEALEINFKLRNGLMLPFLGLREQGMPLDGAKCCGLAAQRGYGAISAYVFHDGQPIHARISLTFPELELAAERFSIR